MKVYSCISDQKLIVITTIFEVVEDVETILYRQLLILILSFHFFLNALEDTQLLFILFEVEREETEGSFERCIIVILNEVSYFFHLQLVFRLPTNQNDVWIAMCIIILLEMAPSSMIMAYSRTTSIIVIVILILVILDDLDFNIGI